MNKYFPGLTLLVIIVLFAGCTSNEHSTALQGIYEQESELKMQPETVSMKVFCGSANKPANER